MMRKETPAYPMTVYQAGLMSKQKLKETLAWRLKLREAYENWKNRGQYEIDFLCPYNGPELSSIDALGLKSEVSPQAIIMGDYMSVKKADLVIANLDTFGSQRPLTGTLFELAWCWQMQKPFIIIAPDKIMGYDDKNEPYTFYDIYTNHPFTGQASFIVKSVEELIEKKLINYFYKRINPANYKININNL
jgi:nucleoside 2-deoxyribosyltransferase